MSKKTGLLGINDLAERLQTAKQELAQTLEENNDSDQKGKLRDFSESSKIHRNKKNAVKKKFLEIDPKLYVSGRLDRKEHGYKGKSFYIHEGLDAQIKAYCRGTEITVYNYLISVGLETIKQLTVMKTVDASEIEEKYKDLF